MSTAPEGAEDTVAMTIPMEVVVADRRDASRAAMVTTLTTSGVNRKDASRAAAAMVMTLTEEAVNKVVMATEVVRKAAMADARKVDMAAVTTTTVDANNKEGMEVDVKRAAMEEETLTAVARRVAMVISLIMADKRVPLVKVVNMDQALAAAQLAHPMVAVDTAATTTFLGPLSTLRSMLVTAEIAACSPVC